MRDGFSFPQTQLRQIFRRDFGNQRELNAFARFVGSEIFFQCFPFPTSHAAKKIDLVRCAYIEIIRREDGASVESGNGARGFLADYAGVALNAGKKFRSLNSILSARLLDPQRGDSQITIIFQRETDQLLQSRIVEEIAPIDVGGKIRRVVWRGAARPRTT